MRRSVPIVVIAVAAVAACHRTDGSVAADVQAYLGRAQAWAAVEGETARTIDRILRTQFVDEAEVRRQIADARPRIAAHLESVHGYSPRTPELERIHAKYIAAWEELQAGFAAIENGFDSGDYTLLARGREAMARWKETVLEVARDLRRLADEHDVDTSPAVRS